MKFTSFYIVQNKCVFNVFPIILHLLCKVSENTLTLNTCTNYKKNK